MSCSSWIALATLLCIAQSSPAQCPFGPPTPELVAQSINDCLRSTRLSVDYRETPFRVAIEDFQDRIGIPIVLDEVALEEAGCEMDHPLSLMLEEVSARSILNLLLHQMHVAWLVQGEKLFITTEKRAYTMVSQTYCVDDFLVTEADYVDERSAEGLMRLIANTIAPQSWQESNDSGRMECIYERKLIVVYQRRDVQEQVQELLDALRRLPEQNRLQYFTQQ